MANTKLKCIICGKEYEGCRTPDGSGIFRWQSVACSPECGDEYIKYLISVANANKKDTQQEVNEKPKEFEDETVSESSDIDDVSLYESDDEYGFTDDPEDFSDNFVTSD